MCSCISCSIIELVETKSVELGHLAVPSGGGPGVIVLHDVWGLYDHFRDVANRVAAHGYVALALDAYRNMEGRPIRETLASGCGSFPIAPC